MVELETATKPVKSLYLAKLEALKQQLALSGALKAALAIEEEMEKIKAEKNEVPKQKLPEGSLYNDHIYRKTTQRLTWKQAEAEAVANGGHLVAINDAAEQQFVEKTFLNGSHDISQVLWIGLHDVTYEGIFVWSNGEELTFTKWNTPTNEPNNFPPGENYVAMNWQWVNKEPTAIFGSWNDLPNNGQTFGPRGPYFGIIEIDPNTSIQNR